MRPGTPGPLWPLPWGALAWAVGFMGSVGSGDPVPGEWGSRKERAGRATHVGLPGMQAVGMLGVAAAVAAGGRWGWPMQVESGRAWGPPAPSPKRPEGGSPGGQQNRCDSHNYDQE